ncbi:hypothetical protein [Candidatus Ferrigenium straubiae]|uniref:hypothetical protein n=1 Tax=Candidatus Ferrigenium straubiae TaxID=2919506 RepID=UPI003F4A9C06
MKLIIKKQMFLMLAILSISGCATASSISWKEEVLLHDGRKMIVERKDVHDSSLPHEIGQGAPLAEHVTTFHIPESNQSVTWRSDNRSRSEPDNLSLMVLDFVKDVPYAAAKITRCTAYNRWGRPNPPYVFFKYDGKAWQRIPLEEFPAQFKEPNVMVGGYDQYSLTVEERDASVLTVDIVRRVNKEAGRSLESYRIIREPLATEWCPAWKFRGFKAPN